MMKLDIQLFASGTITFPRKTGDSSWKWIEGKIEWEELNTSIENNTSQVKLALYCRVGTGGTTGKGWGGQVIIDGNTVISFSSVSSRTIKDTWNKLAETTTTITHNSDGSKSVSMSGYVSGPSGTSISGLKSSGSGTGTLDTIPRASSMVGLTLSNIKATYSYKKVNANFYDVITFKSNGQVLSTVYNPRSSVGTFTGLETNFDISKLLAAATLAGSGTVNVTAELKTYTNSSLTTQVGNTSTISGNVTLGSSSSFSTTQSISNDGTIKLKPTFTKWNAGTYCVLSISGGTYSETINNVSSNTEYTLNNTAIFNAMGVNTSLSLNVKLITKSASNGAILGELSVYPAINLPNYAINISNTFEDLNNDVIIGSHPLSYYKSSNDVMIRRLSNPKITYNISSSTGYLYGRNITLSGALTGSINTGVSTIKELDLGTDFNVSYSLTATDGRKSGNSICSFIFADYFDPNIDTINITRPDGPTAPKFSVNIHGEYYSGENLINLSNAQLKVEWSYDNQNWNLLDTIESTNGILSGTFVYTDTIDPTNFFKKPIYVKATLTDRIGNVVLTTNNIPSGQPVFNTYKDSLGNNYMKIHGELNVKNNQIIEGNLNLLGSGNVAKTDSSNTFSGNQNFDGNVTINENENVNGYANIKNELKAGLNNNRYIGIGSGNDYSYIDNKDNNGNLKSNIMMYDNLIEFPTNIQADKISKSRYVQGTELEGGGGTSGYMYCFDITTSTNYQDQYISFDVLQRGRIGHINLMFTNSGTAGALTVANSSKTGNINAYYKQANNIVSFYIQKSSGWDTIEILNFQVGQQHDNVLNFAWKNQTVTSLPSGYTEIRFENAYSTSEVAVGSWINGATIYRKTFSFTTSTSANVVNINHGISNLNLVIKYEGFFNPVSNERRFLPQFYYTMDGQYSCVPYIVNNTQIQIYYGNWVKNTARSGYITLYYTKS